ncbi:MAG: hypothetical protein AAGD07_12220 [Planctomycetota bacterium]
MKRLAHLMLVPLVFASLASQLSADDRLNARLEKALQKYPEADTNNDGVLTLEEAKSHRDKLTSAKKRRRSATPNTTVANSRAEAKTHSQLGEVGDGAKCLFMGHSFFIPVAKTFDELAKTNGVRGHRAQFVMSGGGSGAPGRLWQSTQHRQAATAILQTGDVEVIGMTYYDESDCSVDDYQRWIDLALKHNPETRVFIGLCWPDSPAASSNEFDEILETAQERLFNTIEELRDRYPAVAIDFVNYGATASHLKRGLEEGNLPEITDLIARGPQAIFRDSKGHAGPLLLELAALAWIEHLYDADIDGLESGSMSRFASQIPRKVAEFNQRFE